MPTFKIGPTGLKETRLKTFEAIVSALRELDADEGIRVIGRIGRLKGGGFIFITRTKKGFAINTCDRVFERRLRIYVAKGMGDILEVPSIAHAISFMDENAKRPLEAVRY